MSTRATTIQILIPSGHPRGIRKADMPARIARVIEIPRSLLTEFLTTTESMESAVYFLFGEGETDAMPRVYVGQTSVLRKRLRSHNLKKGFWQRAVVMISRTGSLTPTHLQYLEWRSVQAARAANRFALDNSSSVKRPQAPDHLEVECEELHETAHWLLSTLGFPIFDPVRSTVRGVESAEEFYLTSSDADGRGLYTPDGMVVLRGSSGRASLVRSVVNTRLAGQRQTLIDSGVIRRSGARVVFTKDHLFSSPSGAAAAVLGRTANGWMEWTTKDGQTLDVVKRQAPATTPL